MSTLEKAVEIAARAHAGQRDKAGAPYLLHPLRLLLAVHGSHARMAAVLHDVVEDTMTTLADLEAAGFDPIVLSAVEALTKRPGESRLAAAERAAADPVALQVKLADVSDNMDLRRIANPTERDHARLAEYRQVKALLESRLAELQTRCYRLWALDDNSDNQAMIARSFPSATQANLELRPFHTAEQFLTAFELELRNGGRALPDFVLLDFFLDTVYGSEVLAQLLSLSREAGVRPGVLIAHSSELQLSEMMVSLGADFALEKIKGQPHSIALGEVFASPAALAWLRKYRRPQPAHVDAPA